MRRSPPASLPYWRRRQQRRKRCWRWCRIPLLAGPLTAAAFLAFLVGWSDYVVTLIVGGGLVVTVPLKVAAAASGTGNDAVVAALSVASVAPPLLLLVVIGAVSRSGRRSRPRQLTAIHPRHPVAAEASS